MTETDQQRRVTVRYHGQSEGSGPLTLGQDNMVRCTLQNDPSDINIQATWPLPAGIDIETALNALRMLTERHESLRTVFTDPEDGQPTRQLVRAAGEFQVEVIETDLDPDEVAAAVGQRDRARRFDLSTEYPLRIALVTKAGRPVRLSAVACHAAVDGAGAALLVREWLELTCGRTLEPPSSPSPREVAEQERSGAGARRIKASVRYWDRLLRYGSQAVFADSSVKASDGMLPTLMVRSGSAAGSLQETARRTGTSPTAVMLAAFAAVIAHRAAQRIVVLAALSANRHKPGLENYVGTLAQDALISLDTDVKDFDELIANAGTAAMIGYWHSTFDAAAIWRLFDDTAYLRGARFARQVVFNDLSVNTLDAPGCDIPAEDPQFAWLPEECIPTRLMLNIWRIKGCLELKLRADPQLFPRPDAEQFARGMLDLLHAAATRTVPLTEVAELSGLTPARRDGDWRYLENSWIDLDAVRRVLDLALDGHRVHLAVENNELTALIAGDERHLTPDQAHEAVMGVLLGRRRGGAPLSAKSTGNSVVSGGLSGWETAMAPHRYMIHDGIPESVDDPQSWARLTVVAEGDGRGGARDQHEIKA